jgi:protease-4
MRPVSIIGFIALLAAVGVHQFTHGARWDGFELIASAAATAAAWWFLEIRPTLIPRRAVLTIRITGAIHEAPARSPIDRIRARGAANLFDLRYALETASKDRKVQAIVAEVGGIDAGLATCMEIHRGLRAVAASGKRVIAILAGDAISLRDYIVAAGASEIVINPDQIMAMNGLMAGSVFLRDAIEKAGAGAQVLQWKEYKGAAETFARNSMSPALRESMNAIVADWERAATTAISAARNIEETRARELINSGTLSSQDAVAARLVDRAGYIQDVRAEFDPADKRRIFVGLKRYLRHSRYVDQRGHRERIAVVFATGPVITGEGPAGGEFVSGIATAEQIERAARDDSVRAIVMRVNSPGGSAVGSELVWRAVAAARAKSKPVVVSMGDVAGSGGYYIAAGADSIVAEETTLTGSIGVVFAKLNLANLMDRVGVRMEYVKSASNSDENSIARPLTDAELAQLDRVIGTTYANFTARVAQGRRLSADQTENVARGRIWSGVAAKSNGLIDETGGMARAIEIARDRAGIDAAAQIELAPVAPRIGLFSSAFGGDSGAVSWMHEVAASAAGVPAGWMPALFSLLARGGVMAICPYLGR